MSIDPDFIKQWCRLDGDAFDAVLDELLPAAVRLASHECGTDYSVEPMPEAVKVWCAAQCAYWIRCPEAAVERNLMPSPFHRGLLDPYRTWA
jgi:hypothetical protein